jgi:hypothetical protein
MAQSLEGETVQSIIGKLARREIDEKVADEFLLRRVRENREYSEPTLWSLLKRYVRRRPHSRGR